MTTEKARAMLKQAKMPLTQWGNAVLNAFYLENVNPTKKNNWESAYQLWFHRPFNYSCLCMFGFWAYINIPKSKQGLKFSDTAKKGVMLGYQLGMHNWHILRADKRVELSHDVTFDKFLYPGIFKFNPAGLQDPALVKCFEEEPMPPVSVPIVSDSD